MLTSPSDVFFLSLVSYDHPQHSPFLGGAAPHHECRRERIWTVTLCPCHLQSSPVLFSSLGSFQVQHLQFFLSLRPPSHVSQDVKHIFMPYTDGLLDIYGLNGQCFTSLDLGYEWMANASHFFQTAGSLSVCLVDSSLVVHPSCQSQSPLTCGIFEVTRWTKKTFNWTLHPVNRL